MCLSVSAEILRTGSYAWSSEGMSYFSGYQTQGSLLIKKHKEGTMKRKVLKSLVSIGMASALLSVSYTHL